VYLFATVCVSVFVCMCVCVFVCMCVCVCVCMRAGATNFVSFDICNSVNIQPVVVTPFLHIASLILYDFNGNTKSCRGKSINKIKTEMFKSYIYFGGLSTLRRIAWLNKLIILH